MEAERIVRRKQEIEGVLQWADDGIRTGSHYRGLKYEEGLIDMYEWLTGIRDESPIDG
jgi:hypothetical protein